MSDTSALRSVAAIVSSKTFLSGLLLVMLGAFMIWGTRELPQGSLDAMGPGMLPRWLGIGIAICGIICLVTGYAKSEPIGAVDLRGSIAVFSAIIIFSLTIREFGLAIAGPLTVIASGLGSRETRAREIIIFGLVITVVCIALFHYALNQPLPVLRLFGVYI
jgi:hypothetical protein